MSQPFSAPQGDSVDKVDNKVAIGEDLGFQRKWWKFERVIWAFFFVILICDVLGLFGRGYLANAKRSTSDQTLALEYERVERAGTPSIMTFHFGPSAVQNGQVQLFISQSMIKKLGAQRISPQPATSTLNEGGVTYAFPASGSPTTVEIALSPSFPGVQHFETHVVGGESISSNVVVVP